MANRNINRYLGGSKACTLLWGKSVLKLIDQRKLPFEEVYVSCKSADSVVKAIKDMVVRGAPAIGVAAGYGVALAALKFGGEDKQKFTGYINEKITLSEKGENFLKENEK